MVYLNSRLCALVAGLALLAAPALRAQTPAVSAAPVIRGDVDGDGRVTRADAEAVRAYLVRGTVPAGRSILPAGDANGDGRVTSADAALISRFAAGVDVSRFPVGQPVTGGGGGGRVDGSFVTAEYQCTVDVASARQSCTLAGPSTEGGAQLDISLGSGPVSIVNSWVHSRGSTADEDTSTNTVAFTNNTGQPLGTTDGSTLAPTANRLYFTTPPYVVSVNSGTVAGSSIRLDNAVDTANFTAVNPSGTWNDRPYYPFNEIVANGDTSSARPMRFVYSANVRSFTYSYRIMSAVQFEWGWITVAPATVPVMAPGETTTLTGTVFSSVGQVLSETITWSSTNTAVATVNSSTGQVTAVAPGTTTITATSTGNAQRTGTRPIIVDAPPQVDSTSPADNATGVLPGSDIVVYFSEPVNVSSSAFTLECPAGSAQSFSVSGSGTATITLSPDGDLPAATTCEVTVDGNEVTDVDTNDGPNLMPGNYEFSFEVAIQAVDDTFTPAVVGNVAVNTANLTPTAYSVTANDHLNAGATITFVGFGVTAGKSQQGGDVSITPSGAGMGQFTYDPPAGYEGTDSFVYVVESGAGADTATVSLTVAGMIWFVDASEDACDGTSDQTCGRLSNPFRTLAEFSAVNDGVGNNPADNDDVFVSEGTYSTPVTLRNGQKLIGQDATATLETLTGETFPDATLVPATNSGNAEKVTLSGADGVNLAQNNAVYGLTVATSAGEAISSNGGGFGTLTLANGTSQAADVTIASGGQALALSNGTLNGVFASVGSTGGTNNVSLVSVGTTGTANLGGGVLSGATGDAFVITNGAGSFTYTGTISNAVARAVNVSGKSGGTVTLSGDINPAVAGGGISVSGLTGGTITFSGAAKRISSGTAPGVSLTSNTGASINFTGGGLTIATTTGVPFTATGGGTVEVSGAGNTISAATPAGLVNLNGITLAAGGMSFASIASTGTSSATGFSATSVSGGSFSAGSLTVPGTTGGSSRGISLSASSAPFTFTSATINGTAAEGIFLNGNTGAVSVDGGSVGGTASPAGDALSITGGNGTVTVAATLTKSTAGRIANIASRTGGTVTLSGSLSCTGSCTGILGNANAGTLAFTSGTKTLTTGTSAAVTLTNNTGTINFTNGGLVINTTSGAGFSATGGGTVNVEGTNNTVNASLGGTAVNIQNTTIGGNGVRFLRVDATGSGTNGIVLSNTGAGSFEVTGDGASDPNNTTRGRTTARAGGGTVALGSGGTISGKSGDAVSLSTTGAVVLRNMVIQNNSGDGVQATGSSGVTIDNTRITGHTDNSALFFTSVSAPVIIHSEMENNAFGAGAPGSDIHNVRLISNTGTGSVQSSVIANTSAGAERQLQILSTTGTLNISVSNTRIAGSTVGDGVGVYAFGSSNITANFQNDSIHNNSAFGLDSGTETTQSSSLNITVNNTKFRNNFVGVTVAHGSSGTNTFNVTNNNFQNHGSVSVNINRLGAVGFTSFGTFAGTVSGNVIGTAGVANSGSPLGTNAIDVKTNGNGGTTQVAIVNNTIREIGNDGIRVIGRDANVGHTLHARIQNNNIANFHASALSGIRGELGAASGDKITMCLNISGNTVANAPQNGVRVRAVAGGSPPPQITLTMPGYDGTGATYLANQNPAATGLTANTSFSNANAGSTTTAGNCTTP